MILENIAEKLNNITTNIIEKNQKAAKNNKLKMFIRNERKTIDKKYYELGRYYYSNLRDTQDEHAEQLCSRIDNSKTFISNAQEKLREINFQYSKSDIENQDMSTNNNPAF